MALDRTLKKRLALTTAMLSVIGGYSRRAYADCTQTSAGTYSCTGTLTAPLVLNGTPLTVTTTAPFSVITTLGSAAVSLTGAGGVNFTDNSASTITGYNYGIKSSNRGTGVLSITTGAGGSVSGGGVGIGAQNYGTGALSITANGDVVSAASGFAGIVGVNEVASTGALSITTGTNSSVTGGFVGIYAVNLGTGALSITANGAVTGGTTGISAEILNAASTGALTITTTAGSTVTGGADGIFAYSTGAGTISVSANGVVSGGVSIVANGNVNSAGTAGDGIYAAINNTASTGGLAITTGAGGSVIGGNHGIFARQSGTGALSITANGIVTGSVIGIYAYNRGAGALSITTGAGGSVTGGTYGIYAKNYGTGALSITASGDVTSTTGGGIYAKNTTAGTDLIINAAAVSGGSFGIGAENFGTGALSITANGNVISTSGVGIFAGNYLGTDLSVIAAAVSGGTSGIVAANAGTGATSVIATGDVTGMADYGILAVNGTPTLNSDGTINSITATNGTDLSVTAGNVTGGITGIFANNTGTGALSITSTGTVTGTSRYGIYARNNGTSLTINAAAVSGGSSGIVAANAGTGATSVTTTGDVTGTTNYGILAVNGVVTLNPDGTLAPITGPNGTDLSVTTGNVTGGTTGIFANNTGTGALSITATGTVTGTSGEGIAAQNAGTGALSITAAAVNGRFNGIFAKNYGTGALSITSIGAVSGGTYGNGILAINYGTSLTISTAAVSGGIHGIAALNYGTDALSIISTGPVTGTITSGIGGIYAKNYGTSLTISTAAVNGGGNGIDARNYGTGALSITANGTVTGGVNGIFANNNGTDLTISAAAAVSGGASGIVAANAGTGATSVTTTGDVTGTTNYGILAVNGTPTFNPDGTINSITATNGTDLSVTAGNVTGGITGIYAANTGTGPLSIIANGDVTGSKFGIDARSSFNSSGDQVITTAAGSTVTGGESGIYAGQFGTRALSITANGNVTGTSGDGIYAGIGNAGSTGALTITVGMGSSVAGGRNGIYAFNLGTDALSITANGTVTGGVNGIYAYNGATAGGLSITAGGRVTGTSGYGIEALNTGSGPTAITVNTGGVVQGAVAGIFVDPVAPIAITNAGTIQNLSGVSDALAIKTAGAPTTITNTGTITGVVALGDLGNRFSNSGTWNTAGGSNAFGALVASNSLTNQAGGTIIAASAGSTAAQTTSFNHVGTFTNAGLVMLQNGFAGDRAIVQGNFVGTGGTVALDTVLGADSSASDQLVLNGGHTSGTTLLQIANAGGSGAQTTGDGIAVVVAQNGATSSAGAFKLNGQVAAGAYQYELFEGGNAMTGGNPNDENWYLRDTLIVTPPPPPDDTSGGTPPPPPTVPNYRDEVPVYLAMPELANTVSLAMIGTYDTRMGGDRESVGTLFAPDTQPLVWGRVLGATGQQKPGDQTGLNTSNDVLNGKGPRYGYDYVGLQLGMDLLRKASSDGSHDHVGAYGGLVHATANVDAIYDTPGTSAKAGTLNMDAYSLGLYWTHFGVSDWYSDVVMQGTWFGKVKGQTVNTAMDVQGAAFTASLEGGYPFHFAESWTVEPQGQIVFQHQNLGDGVDHFGLTSFDDVNDARGRIGTKISQTRLMGEGAIPLTLWARADLWHDFAASNPSATFANLSGGNPVTLDGSLRGTWAQIDAGVSGHLTQSISVFGSLFYEHAIDGTQSWSAGGSGGIKSTGVNIGAEMRF